MPTPARTPARVHRHAGSVAALLALLLAACAAPPPVRPPVAIASPPPPPIAPAEIAAPVPTVEPATTSPVAGPSSTAAPTPLPVIEDESPAVAARFPDPPLVYDTPAFAPGRSEYTTNAELRTALRGLLRDAGAAAASTRVLLLNPGQSQSGVPIEALLFTRVADPSPAGLLASGRPTLLLVGQQHGDEPAGAEALLVLARQLAHGPLEPLLDRINVLVLPRANPDGAQSGRRDTASGIDPNRDHLLLNTPEAQAQAALLRDYRPMVVVDAHEFPVGGAFRAKFGALRRSDALLQYATTANQAEFVTRAAEEWFRRPMAAALQREKLRVDWYHQTSDDPADRRVAMGGVRPDTARNANGLRNAISLLVESRGIGIGRAHLARRVQTHVVAIAAVLRMAAARADDLVKLRGFVDNEVSAKACQGEVAIEAAATPSEYQLPMLDPVTGADRDITVAWDSTLQLELRRSRTRPCGYWLAAEQQDAVLRLRALGIAVRRVEATGVMRGETYTELARADAALPDGRASLAATEAIAAPQVQTVPVLFDVTPGSWYVPLDQPLANLAVAALEPDAPGSYVAHGVIPGVAGIARVLLRPEVRTGVVP